MGVFSRGGGRERSKCAQWREGELWGCQHLGLNMQGGRGMPWALLEPEAGERLGHTAGSGLAGQVSTICIARYAAQRLCSIWAIHSQAFKCWWAGATSGTPFGTLKHPCFLRRDLISCTGTLQDLGHVHEEISVESKDADIDDHVLHPGPFRAGLLWGAMTPLGTLLV